MTIRPKGRAYAAVVAVTVAILVVGLAIPLIFANPDSSSSAAEPTAGTGVITVHTGKQKTTPTSAAPSAPVVNTSGPLTASDQGVTATTIKVGVVLLNLAPVVPLGLGLPNYQTSLQQSAFNTYFDRINSSGGIYGRKIVPVYAQFNPLSSTGPGSAAAICLQFVKDDQVFAIMGVSDPVGQCSAVQYQVPYIGANGLVNQYYTQSHNYLITSGSSLERTGENWAAFLVGSGLITGHKVGMLGLADGNTEQLSGNAAEQTLAQLGHPLTYRAQIPDNGSNAASIMPVLVHNMQEHDVDMVMLPTSFATAVQFMTAAQSAHYYPQYLTSDIGSLSADGLLSKAPKVFNGAIGVTAGFYLAQAHSGETEPADLNACRTEFNEATGKDLTYGESSPLSIICTDVDILQRGTTGAGTDLTRAGFVAAVERVGTWQLPGLLGGVSAPGRTDFSNALQPVRWSSTCQCYSTAGPVVQDKY
jgi:hypothetical protein